MLSDGDANEDGNVDAIDLAIWEGQFGNVAAAAAAIVPEPASWVLLICTMAMVTTRWRQRC